MNDDSSLLRYGIERRLLMAACTLIGLTMFAVAYQPLRVSAAAAPGPVTAPVSQTQGQAVKAQIKTQGKRVWLENVDPLAGWGRGEECTFMGSVGVALRAAGEDVNYDWLMGVSGHAFRLQLAQPDWNGAAPDAGCGFKTIDPLKKAVGYTTGDGDTFDGSADKIAAARKMIMESIDRGVPVMGINLTNDMDWGVITGYDNDGATLLCRSYEKPQGDYMEGGKKPYIVVTLAAKEQAPSRRENIINSLKLAVKLARTGQFDKYAAGLKAYELWINQLRDDAKWDAMAKEKLPGNIHCNFWVYYSLYDARASASRYLLSISDDFTDATARDLMEAAELYRMIEATLGKGQKFAPPVASMKNREWTADMRHGEADVLAEARALEERGIMKIEEALKTMGQ